MPRVPRVTEVHEPPTTRPALGQYPHLKVEWPGVVVEPIDGKVPEEEAPVVEPSTAEVRAWAIANDIQVAASGQVSGAVWDAYREAHGGRSG